jgi:hypothetical protein
VKVAPQKPFSGLLTKTFTDETLNFLNKAKNQSDICMACKLFSDI